jgi:hypothetical protein
MLGNARNAPALAVKKILFCGRSVRIAIRKKRLHLPNTDDRKNCATAVVRLALADATVPQIATFTGHSLAGVEQILDHHYLGRDVKLAEIAVMKLESRTKL